MQKYKGRILTFFENSENRSTAPPYAQKVTKEAIYRGNTELKLFTMEAKYNYKGFERKKVETNFEDVQRGPEPILVRMDNFLTSDALENLSYDKMKANYNFYNDKTPFLRCVQS